MFKRSSRIRQKLVIEQELIFDLIALWFAGFMIINFWKYNSFLTLSLLLVWLIAIRLWYEKEDILIFGFGALLGSIGEINCIAFGIWTYSNPNMLWIPTWLPFLWGFVSVIIKRVYITMDQNRLFFRLK